MNRLWVRLSLMLSSVLFMMFFLQFLEIMFVPDEPVQTSAGGDARDGRLDDEPDRAEIAGRLLEFMGLSLVVGLVGGIVIARVVSAPITELAAAANRIGTGKLDVRVPVRGSRELRELSESFNRMAADLQHAEKLRNNLMADVSHELRTPLTVLEGNLRAALDRVYALDEAEIANLYGQTRHLIRLVNDLRELALAESGQLSLEKTHTNLHTLVTETLLALEPLAAEKEVRVIDRASDLPPVSIDPFRIRQVLFNLLTNALRHTPSGGSITVDATHDGRMVTLSIRDTGDGLEPEQLASVFDRFYRADKSRSRESGGTGLGLAIVKAIVEAHHGHVEASSAGKGLGSQFSVHLPVASE